MLARDQFLDNVPTSNVWPQLSKVDRSKVSLKVKRGFPDYNRWFLHSSCKNGIYGYISLLLLGLPYTAAATTVVSLAVFLYCCSACPSYPTHLNSIGLQLSNSSKEKYSLVFRLTVKLDNRRMMDTVDCMNGEHVHRNSLIDHITVLHYFPAP